MDPTTPATGLTAESSTNVLDGAVFQELVESLTHPDVVAAIYRKFVENAAGFIGELRDQNAAARIETLHTLKGSASMMGARELARLAAHLETQLISQGSSDQVDQATEQLAGELGKFRAAAAGRLLALGASLGIPE